MNSNSSVDFVIIKQQRNITQHQCIKKFRDETGHNDSYNCSIYLNVETAFTFDELQQLKYVWQKDICTTLYTD
ncbi:unnamed protein product [Didymodactylos carnosus]|uniref:Uncharacterized protein n=1 Tax=Didymodactylos carnosus TaxID=1234261 RepID=A0A8S2S310_9BILA|nr:unnamed protein product [Didymodactylos carnosus]CAF4194657.1 unnamed protein product [Didymodactylos carnosus]